MTRGGRTKTQGEAERRCIATGETGPKHGLIRFVIGPDATVVPDIEEALPGRGIWVSPSRKAIGRAAAKGLFARAARQPVKSGGNLSDLVEQMLLRRVVELLSLARKAGVAVAGLEKTKARLIDGSAGLLLQASDGSAREKARLRPPNGPESHVQCLTAAELGLAFGRQNVIHAALKSGGLTDKVQFESSRLAGLRSG
jgi:predicted RNA-binding protein YlxR (DUF448 family)